MFYTKITPNLNISARMSRSISETLKPFKKLAVVYHQVGTFLCRFCTTTTWNDQMVSFFEDRNRKAINPTISAWTRAQAPFFSSNINSLLFSDWATWNNHEMVPKNGMGSLIFSDLLMDVAVVGWQRPFCLSCKSCLLTFCMVLSIVPTPPHKVDFPYHNTLLNVQDDPSEDRNNHFCQGSATPYPTPRFCIVAALY